jgi:hypothetical protein
VDLVVNGHKHIYERNNPLIGGKQTVAAPSGSTVTPATHGTTYIVAGAGGESLYSFGAPDSYEGAVNADTSISSYVNEVNGTTPAANGSPVKRFTGAVPLPRCPASRLLLRRGDGLAGELVDEVRGVHRADAVYQVVARPGVPALDGVRARGVPLGELDGVVAAMSGSSAFHSGIFPGSGAMIFNDGAGSLNCLSKTAGSFLIVGEPNESTITIVSPLPSIPRLNSGPSS